MIPTSLWPDDSLTKQYDLSLLDTVLEDLKPLTEPLLRSGFYIESFGLLNHIETS